MCTATSKLQPCLLGRILLRPAISLCDYSCILAHTCSALQSTVKAFIGMADPADAPIATSERPVCDLAATRLLLTSGVSIVELKRLQVSASELKEAGCSAKDLQNIYSCKEIKCAGFEPLILLDCGWRGDQFSSAGFTVHELKNAGFSAQQCKRDWGFSDQNLRDMGISQLDIAWLHKGGYYVRDLVSSLNFDAMQLKNGGYTALELRGEKGGVSLALTTGFSAYELKQAGIGAAWLLAGGWRAAELASRVDDLAIFSVSEMREAGVDAATLTQIGYSLQDLQACGYDPSQLADAGVSRYTDCCIRDCCINGFERAGCDHIPHEPDESYFSSDCLCGLFRIFWILLSGRCVENRIFNWFFHPFEAFLGMCSVCNMRQARALKSQEWYIDGSVSILLYIVGYAYSLVCSAVSLFACLPCFMCFSLARCVRQLKRSFNKKKRIGDTVPYQPPPTPLCDAVFWVIYTPLLFMAMSGRWMWKVLCGRRSCFGFSRSVCGPSCTLNHGIGSIVFAETACMLCGRSAEEHSKTKDFHTCRDGRRGSFLKTGPEYDDGVDQNACQV